jgi:ergothioneine biosynthesis protein EgtB
MPSLDLSGLRAAADVRRAGRNELSLALMEARNRLLASLNAIGPALAAGPTPSPADVDPPHWLAGHAAWFHEYWIARNVQRQRGPAADPTHPRLASVEARADDWYDPRRVDRATRWSAEGPGSDGLRRYLVDTLEVTLALLDAASDDDAALYPFRLAVLHEEAVVERLAESAHVLGLRVRLFDEPPVHAPRDPLLMPATRWRLGSEPVGFVFDDERWAHDVAVPEFEIDAQPVNWQQYAEFVADGGYDEDRWWSPAGRAWREREARRAPRFVEQMRRGVLLHRFGRPVWVQLQRPVSPVTAHEAEAWCRWAGRRLPSEVEWEAAAHQAVSRGFRWGEVREWTGTTYGPYPGFEAGADPLRSQARFGKHRTLRGVSAATPRPLHHTKLRDSADPTDDTRFCGFRSCAP